MKRKLFRTFEHRRVHEIYEHFLVVMVLALLFDTLPHFGFWAPQQYIEVFLI